MRIVGGELGGRPLKAPSGGGTRPTTDRVREAIASVLQARDLIEDAHVLDLFCGSGALGFEALSRGAAQLLSVDGDGRALRCVQDNARSLGLLSRASRLKVDLLRDPARAAERIAGHQAAPFTLVFADPPYAQGGAVPRVLESLAAARALSEAAAVVVEHARDAAPEAPADFEVLGDYRYGDSGVRLLRRVAFCEESQP
jgi:16S rRNA (guanine966-N2)-methyltransferase